MTHHKSSMFSLHKVMIFILLVLCFNSSTLQATEAQETIVLELYPHWYSNEDFAIQGNAGIEKLFQNNNWVQYYLSPSVAYSLTDKWGLHGGLGFYYSDYDIRDNNFEIRPFQGVSHFMSLTEKWTLSSYLRAEERFQYNTNTEEKESTLRLRLRFRTSYTINPLSKDHSWHKFMLGVEGFRSFTENQTNTGIQDNYESEARFILGIERSLKKSQKVRFELAVKYQEPPGNLSKSSVNTVYFKIQYYPVWGDLIRNKLLDRGIDD